MLDRRQLRLPDGDIERRQSIGLSFLLRQNKSPLRRRGAVSISFVQKVVADIREIGHDGMGAFLDE